MEFDLDALPELDADGKPVGQEVDLNSLPELDADGKPAEPEKKSLGIFGTLGAQTDAKAGRKVGTVEAIAENIPVVGQIMDAEYNRQWHVIKRLYEGDFKSDIEARMLAKDVGISEDDMQRITDEAGYGGKNLMGNYTKFDMEKGKALYKELVAPEFAKRLQVREQAQQQLNENDLNWVQKGVVGGAGATKLVGSMANFPVAMATLGIDATNRAAQLLEGKWVLDENGQPTKIWWRTDKDGNPVRDEAGNLVPREEVSQDMAVLKGITGAATERFIWMGLGKATKWLGAKAIGKMEQTAAGAKVSEALAKATSGTMKGVQEATQWLEQSAAGRGVLNIGKVIGWLNSKGKFGSIPDMMLKSRIQELADNVVGLAVADPADRESFSEWVGKFFSVKENAELFTEMLAMHLAMKTGGLSLNMSGRALEKIGLKEAREFDRKSAIGRRVEETVAELAGEERAAKLTDKDLVNLYRIVTSDGFTAERAEQFAEKIAGDVDEAQKLIDEGASLSSLAEGLKARRQYSDQFVEGAKAAAAELRDRVTLDGAQSGRINDAALKAAEGNVEIAAKVAALAKSRLTNKHTQVDDANGLESLVAEAMRPFAPEARAVKIHDMKGSRNVGEQLTALEELGIGSVEDAELNGVVRRDENGHLTGGARQAVNIATHGTDALKSAVKDGSIDAETAEALITAAHTELGAEATEARAAFIDGILERAKGDAALARKMAENEMSEFGTFLSSWKSGNEAEIKEELDASADLAKTELKLEAEKGATSEISSIKLSSIEGGVLGCSRFRSMSAEFGESTDENGNVSKKLSVKGLGEGQLAKPGNWADGAVLVAELQRVAEKNGAVLDFGSVEANIEATGLLNKVQTEGLERAKARLETRAKLFDVLARTALDKGVTFDESSFRKALEEVSNGRRLVDNHGNIYGFASPDGTLHFNPTQLDYNIPIHEYGHLALESMKGVNRRLWERGMELVKGSDYYRSIKEQAETEGHEYSYLKGDEAGICDEALAHLIGDNGEKLVEAQGVGAELKAWLKDFWKAFKGAFGLADLGEAQIEKMTLGEFADAVTAELLRGKEFGTRKQVPLKEKSIKRYDEADGSGSNGVLRWKNDRGRLFNIPVDMERTQPGGRVVLSTDDANITDWIKNRLNGVELRMSKKGKIYVEGRNGFDGELAEIFGRYPKAGQNDGIGEELASVLHNDSLREATPDQLVEMLAKDRANYDEWVKATRDGKGSLEDAKLDEYYADQAERAEYEARRRWEDSGMDVPEYILSRIEEGEPGFDLEWETMRELAHDEAEGRFAVRRKRVGKVEHRVPPNERRAFRSEYNKILADYAHNNNGDIPKSCGLFTSEAYYIFDIIDSNPLNIHRIKINDRNREKISALDKKYKSEIYKGTRDSAYWFDRIGNELSEYLQGRDGNQDRKAGDRPSDLDLRAGETARGRVPDARGNNAAGEGEAVSVTATGAQGGAAKFAVGGRVAASNMGIKGAAEAEAMEKTGADREKIWRETGWWKGKDGKWRFELPRMRRGAWHGDPEERHFTGGGDDFYRYRLTELVKNDDFFKAYPQAKKITVEFHKGMPTNVGGNFNEATLTIKLPQKYQVITDYAKYGLGEGKAAGLNAAGAKTIEHELQHAVQLFESFAKGGSPSDPVRPYALDGNTGHALSVFAEANGMDVTNDRHLAIIASNAQKIASDQTRGEMPKRLVEAFEAAAKEAGKTPAEFSDEINRLYDSHTDSPMGQYFKLAGEVEARNAQFRANMTPEERAATPPWETEDIPESRQIVRFAVGKAVGPSALGDGKQRYYEVPFDKAVDKIVANRRKNGKKATAISGDYVFVGETPSVLEDIGFVKLPIMMTQHHIETCFFNEMRGKQWGIAGHMHGLGSTLKRVPAALKEPVMVIASKSPTGKDTSVVAITSVPTADGDMILPIVINGEPNTDGSRITAHVLTSAHGRKNTWKGLVSEAIETEENGGVGIFYIDKAKASKVFTKLAQANPKLASAGLKYAKKPQGNGTLHSIADADSPVKGQAGIVKSQTATRQFKNWFGGSQVVDENGEPLVVYRGSEYDPLAQEPGKGVIKPEAYFTADPEYAKRYTGNSGKVRAYYLNIRNPFDIRRPECLADLKKIYPDHEFQKGKSGALDWAEASTIDGEFLKENFGDKYDGIIYDEGGDPGESGISYRGISYVPLDGGAQVKSATDNIGTFDSGNPDVRFAVGGQQIGDFVVGPNGIARRGTPQATMIGGARVADDAGRGEQTPGSMAAALERLNQPRTTIRNVGQVRPMSLPLSEMEALRKMLTGDHLPATIAKKIARGGFAAHTKAGRLTIAASVFGLVDKTDVAPAKDRLKQHGFFRNEDEAWAANHSEIEVRRERERSEGQLGDELLKIADRRARGAEAGGESAARGVYANELAKIVMDMPRKEGGVIGRVQKIGDAVRANVKALMAEKGGAKGAMAEEAKRFLDWARGGEAERSSTIKSDRELTDEMFASWLIMPEEMGKIAPTWSEAILRTVAETPKLAEAFKELSLRALSKDSHRAVFEAVRKSQGLAVEKALKELEADRTEKISAGSRLADAKEKVIVTFHDTLGAVAVRIDEKTRQYLKARRKVLAEMKARGATKADIAAVENEIDLFSQKIGHLKNRMELSRTAMERGTWNEGRRYMLQYLLLENKATKKWGLSEEDKSAYLDMMRIVETQGRAASYGMDPRQARLALGDMARRLGAEKWARLEEYGREFFSVMEREFLNDPRVERMWGKGMIDYFRTQAHYVTTKRVQSAEELDAIETARAKARAAGVNGGDDVIGAMFTYAGPRGGASALGLNESAWKAKLTGSMGAKQEVRSATWEKQQMLMQSARRNQFVLDLRDALLEAKVEGVRDVARGDKDVKPGSRYGTINYVENGVRRTLIVPKQIAEGMKSTPDNMPWLTKFHNAARGLMIDWNVAYWNRNVMRNSGSIEKNMPGMHETWLKTVLRVAPGMAPTVDLACQHLARHSKGAAKAMGALFGRDTIFPYIQQAGRMAKLLEDPTAWQERLWDAEARGDTAEVAEMHEDLRQTMEMLKGNMFLPNKAAYGNRETQGFANDMMNKAGFRMVAQMQQQAARTRLGRAVDLVKSPFKRNERQQEYEDVLAKSIAYLHDRAVYGAQRSVEESGLTVKRNVSIAEGERKGTESRTIQRYMTQFFNMTEKGVTRTVRAMRERPGETLGKMARTWVGRFVGSAITYGLVTRAIRALYGDDEEKAKASPLGEVYGFAKWIENANRNLSNYVRNHYQTIPLWVSDDGYTTIVLGTPLNDEDSLLAPSADFAAAALANTLGAKNDLALGQMLADTFIRPVTPDLAIATPALKVIRDTIEATMVQNPTDLFTGAPTYDRDLYALRNESWETRGDFALAMARQVYNDVGARGFMAVDRQGVDNGMGAAPKWIGLALKKIPILSPVLNSFVKVQVGSPEKDAKPIRADEQRLQHVRNYLSRKLMLESSGKGGALNRTDPQRYAELLEGWQNEYGLSDHDMRLIEKRFLNGWTEHENEEVRRRKVIQGTLRKARKMGIEDAERYMIRGDL